MKPAMLVGLLCAAGAILLAILAILSGRRQGRNPKSQGTGGRYTAALIHFYSVLDHYSLTRALIGPIRKRLEVYGNDDERTLRKKTVTFFLTATGLSTLSLLLFWVITQDAVMLLLFGLILAFIADAVVDITVTNVQIRLMKQQLTYHEMLRHKYYELKSVEDANYEACSELNTRETYEIYAQAERINDILAAKDMEASLTGYYDTAPNRYLKLLAGMIYMTREYGDSQVNGCSVFIKGIGYLSNEIRAEVFKREKLKYALRSLNVIAILPVFFVKPIREWAGKSFAPLETFYAGSLGIILGVLTIAAAFLSYLTLKRIQRFDRSGKPDLDRKTLEERLYSKGLHPVVDRLIPRGYTKQRKRLEELLRCSQSRANFQLLYTRRVLSGALLFLSGLVLFLYLHQHAVYRIQYVPEMPKGYLGGKLSQDEMIRLQTITDLDRRIMEALDRPVSLDQLKDRLHEEGIDDEASREIAMNRILSKLSRVADAYFKWYELILCIVLFGIGYQMPVWSLHFLKSVRRIDMEEEVSQFQTIILMLMHMGRIHVEEILEWMEMFSVHFKGPIQKCLLNFSSGSGEALERLREDAAFPQFVSLIENLQLANEELGVQRAFEELENEMAYSQEKRKQLNDHIVESKRNLGNLIGFLPVYAMVILYLIVPMIVAGFDSISTFYDQIAGF